MDRYSLPSDAAGDADRVVGRVALWVCLALFVVVGVVIRAALAIRLRTIHRPDEWFQSIEPAYRLWSGRGVITWEWREGIRSWLFPDFLDGIMQTVSLLHLPERAALPAIWLVLSIVSAGVIVVGVGLGWRRWGLTGAALGGTLTAFWPDLVYFGPKTLLEVQSGNLLVIAAGLASLGISRRTRWRAAAIGVLLGLSFDLRFQLGPALALIAIWAARLEWRRGWVPLALGAALPIAALGLLDWWDWGTPFQSVWKNVVVNLVESRSLRYGVSPVGAYLFEIVRANGAATIPLLLLFLFGARDAPLFAVLTVLVVSFHSLIAHKEISFIYAALPCALIPVGLGAARLVRTTPQWLRRTVDPDRATIAGVVVVLVAALLTAAAERPYAQSRVMQGLQDLWGTASLAPDLCGLGLYSDDYFPWAATLGYAGLRRPEPIYLLRSPEALTETAGAFNYAIAEPSGARDLPPGYDRVRCSHGYCLLHRAGTCRPAPQHEISRELIQADE